MREMIMLFYLKRERERKFEIKWRKRKKEFVLKKKGFTTGSQIIT